MSALNIRMQGSMRRLAAYGHAHAHAVAATDLWLGVLWQMTAGCRLAISCSALSALAAATAQDWQHLARNTYTLLHGAGLDVLRQIAETVLATAETANFAPATAVLLSQLHAAAALASGMPLQQQLEAGLLQPDRLRAWLSIFAGLMLKMRQLGGQGETADVTAIWCPNGCLLQYCAHRSLGQLVSRNAVASQFCCAGAGRTRLACPCSMPTMAMHQLKCVTFSFPSLTDAGWVQQPVLPYLPELAHAIYSCHELVTLWRSEQASELRLVQLLMPALPAMAVALRLPADRCPPGCSWETAANILRTLNLPPIKPAVETWHAAADSRSLLSTLCSVAQLLAGMEFEQPAADSAAPHEAASAHVGASVPASATQKLNHNAAVAALEVLSRLVRYAAQQVGQQTEQEQRRVARSLLPVLARLPSLAALASSPDVMAAAAARQQSSAGDAPPTLVSSYCILVGLLLVYVGGTGAAAAGMHSILELIPTRGDAAAWCSAASAGLSAIPLLAQWQTPAAKLVQGLVELASTAGSATSYLARQRSSAGSAAAAAEETELDTLMQALWTMHTRTARLAHFAASGGGGAALLFQEWKTMTSMLNTLSTSMAAASWFSEKQAAATGSPPAEHTSR